MFGNASVNLLLRRLLIVFLIYQITRILFILFNQNTFIGYDFKSFLGGLVFDLSAIAYINLLFIIAHLIPIRAKFNANYQKILKISFFVVNGLFIATNFIDLEYYKFTGKRSTFGLITAKGMENEIAGLVSSFLVEFWYVLLFFMLILVVFWKALGNLKNEVKENFQWKSIAKNMGILLLFLGVGILFGRGGFGKKPLRIVDAVHYNNQSPEVVLNTPFSILKTIGKNESLVVPKFYEEQELLSIFDPVYETNPTSTPLKNNVVLIILESFGDENIHVGQTPFLDSLITESLYFKNGFANGRLSIDAVPSILSSIPSLMQNSLITSSFSLNDVYGLPKILKENGYGTSFFHGAFNGSQNFDQYSKVAGFDQYFGKNEYVGPEAFDGKWGIFDEEFLQFFGKKLGEFQQPFFSTIFTISSHNPYIIPDKYKGKFPKGTTKVMETIAYTDHALKLFFESVKNKDWYQNTLFVLTADHTFPEAMDDAYKTSIGRFEVPIIFFHPSNPALKGEVTKNLQQTDIMPSIIDYLNIKTKMVTFGKSYLSDKDFVVYYLNDIYHYINGDYYMKFDGVNAIGLYNFRQDKFLEKNLLEVDKNRVLEMEKFIKAYIQTFNGRMVNNQLIVNK